MEMQMIFSLFRLFSGEEDTEHYLPLLMSAIQEVKANLKEESDITEVRLCYLVSAIANLRYTQMHGAKEKALATYAGTIARTSNAEQQLLFAEHLVDSYRELCSDLLKERKFFFFSVRS